MRLWPQSFAVSLGRRLVEVTAFRRRRAYVPLALVRQAVPLGVNQTGRNGNRWAILASLSAHSLILGTLGLVMTKHLDAPQVRSIAVQIITPQQFREMTEVVPEQLNPNPRPAPTKIISPPIQAMPPPQARPLAEDAAPGMIRSTQFFASGILKDPANRQVRDTLPLLAPDERITQLCNIEALEQLRKALPESFPDSMVASAFKETSIDAGTLDAPGGAYRSDRQWYAIRFSCSIAPDYESVVDFQFQVGAPIPQGEWESHNLIPEDFDID